MRTHCTTPKNLAVDKALHAAAFIGEALGHPVFADRTEFANWLHDLSLVAAHGNLRTIRVTAIGRDGEAVYQHTFGFGAAGFAGGRFIDPAEGIELPMLPKGVVRKVKLTWKSGPDGKSAVDCAAYANRLRIRWSSATLPSPPTAGTFDSAHHRKITAGRASASVRVAAAARRSGTIYNVGTKAFFFIRDDEHGADGNKRSVFALKSAVRGKPPGLRKGQRVDYVLITTPNGLQARDIALIR